jgi:hypothetical protein
MGKFTVIDGGGESGEPTPPAPDSSAMAVRLRAMVEECLKSKPIVAMLVWESGEGGTTQMQSLITPPSQVVFRGLVELMYEQAHSGEL